MEFLVFGVSNNIKQSQFIISSTIRPCLLRDSLLRQSINDCPYLFIKVDSWLNIYLLRIVSVSFS